MENKSKISQIIFLIMKMHIFASRDKTQNVDMENSFCKMPYKFNKTCIKCDAIFLVMASKMRMIYCYCTSKVKTFSKQTC